MIFKAEVNIINANLKIIDNLVNKLRGKRLIPRFFNDYKQVKAVLGQACFTSFGRICIQSRLEVKQLSRLNSFHFAAILLLSLFNQIHVC